MKTRVKRNTPVEVRMNRPEYNGAFVPNRDGRNARRDQA